VTSDATIGVDRGWWRPKRPTRTIERPAAVAVGGDELAFGALIAFTVILLVSPQAWFPAIKSLRIALLSAALAAVAHLGYRLSQPRVAEPPRPELAIAVGLIAWAAVTVPMSIWPGGSLDQLTDHLLKAVIFFWLIATVLTSTPRLVRFGWVLTLCAMPLALTALNNYRSGEFVTTAGAAVQRIAGYTGGSGLAGNPNDLALMMNLLIPIAGAMFVCSRSTFGKAIAAITIVISAAAVITTFSRAGFITLAAITAMSMAALARHKAPGVALVILLAGVSAPLLLPEGYFNRLATITNFEADVTGSAQGRWEDFVIAGRYIGGHPIVGAGLGQDLLALNQARGHETWRSVHNAFLQAGVDLGLPGMALLAALLVASLRSAGRVRAAAWREGLGDLSVIAQGVQISLVAFAVAAMFHPIAYQFYLFCFAGLAVALRNAYFTEVTAQP
jgi:hypothetical protein